MRLHMLTSESRLLRDAQGWNYLFKYLVVFGNNLNACALVLSYWDDTTSPAVYITTFAVACILCNMLPVRAFGEAEFWMSGLKLLVVLGLIILNIVLAAGGGPTGDAPGFRNWQHGLAFRPYKADGDLGRFLGFWSTLTTSLFAFVGTELVCVTVGETANPRKSISKATKQTLLRILVCYVGGVFSLGLVVPSNSPQLAKATSAATSASSSPFVVAIQLAAIPILPAIVNGALLIFVSSAANSDQYISSRTLHSLAMEGQAPSWLKKTMKNGIPLRSSLVTFPFFALAYINLASDGAKAFGYLSSTVTMFGGLMWWGMLLTHIRFMKACKAQGISRESLPHRSPLQPYASYVAFFIVNLVLFFKGFPGFIGGFDWRSFITNYIGIPIFIILYFGWKIASGSKIVDLNEVDMTYMDEQDLDVLDWAVQLALAMSVVEAA